MVSAGMEIVPFCENYLVYSEVLDTKPTEQLWNFHVVCRSQHSLPDEKPSHCSAPPGEAPSQKEGSKLPQIQGFGKVSKWNTKSCKSAAV